MLWKSIALLLAPNDTYSYDSFGTCLGTLTKALNNNQHLTSYADRWLSMTTYMLLVRTLGLDQSYENAACNSKHTVNVSDIVRVVCVIQTSATVPLTDLVITRSHVLLFLLMLLGVVAHQTPQNLLKLWACVLCGVYRGFQLHCPVSAAGWVIVLGGWSWRDSHEPIQQ